MGAAVVNHAASSRCQQRQPYHSAAELLCPYKTQELVPKKHNNHILVLAMQAAAMSASKGKPPNSASKLRPSILGGGSRDKGGEKTPSRGILQRMPWGARTPKRGSEFSDMGVERRYALLFAAIQ